MLLITALLLAPAATAVAQSRSQEYGTVAIAAQLADDGSMRVVERREILYRGQWNGEVYRLPLRDGQSVQLNSLTDDRGVTYRPGSCSPDGAREPGAYELLGGGDLFEVAWCWDPPPVDTTRTMEIDYTVTNAGVRHDDSSELYWQWVGTGWDERTQQVVADVTLPTAEDVQFWAHGPLTGEVRQTQPGVVRTEVRDLQPNTFVELRVLMPADALAAAPSDGTEQRDAILAEEGCLAREANAERARAAGQTPTEDCDPDAVRKSVVSWLVGLVALIGVGGWWLVFTRHGREHPLPPDIAERQYEHDLPSDHAPAHVGYLLDWGSVKETALTATVLDLARRGHLRLRRDVQTRDRLLLPDVEEPITVFEATSMPERPWERDVMDLLFDRAGSGAGVVTDEQLKTWVSKNREKAYRWWQSWTSAVTRDTAGQRWIDSYTWVGVAVMIGLGMLGAAVAGLVFGANVVVIVLAALAGVAMLAASPLMRRRTLEGRVLEQRWRKFGDYLRDYSLIPERGPEYLALWGTWLVYAVPLGVAETVARNLETKLSEAQMQEVGGGWYPMMYHHGHLTGGFSGGLSSVAAAIPASQIASSPSSSSSGGGGGFSGGGGGGGGGSGGGGF